MDPTPPVPVAPTPVVRRSWWDRNWKWFVPTGCLTLVGLAVAFTLIIVFAVFAAMKSSDAYKLAVARAKADPRVIAALGRPITEGMFTSGNTQVNGASGQADLAIPISGPKGKATIYLAATKFAGKWTFSKLLVQVDGGGDAIDLNESESP